MKKIISYLIVSACVFLSSSAQSEIFETEKIADVFNHASEENTLFLFNISDTLYIPSNTLASNLWRLYFAEQTAKMITDPIDANIYINQIKNLIVSNIPKIAAESDTSQLINKLQNNKQPVLGITRKQMATAYADNFGEITYKHLLSIGIDLKKTLDYLTLSDNQDIYSFNYGIIFTNKLPEGPVLHSFMTRMPSMPNKVVMIDNSYESLESTRAAVEELGINFIGIRYSRYDDSQKNFDPDLGTIQFLQYMKDGTIISDHEANQVKVNHPEVNFEKQLKDFILKQAYH